MKIAQIVMIACMVNAGSALAQTPATGAQGQGSTGAGIPSASAAAAGGVTVDVVSAGAALIAVIAAVATVSGANNPPATTQATGATR